jgi:hypothetical protein
LGGDGDYVERSRSSHLAGRRIMSGAAPAKLAEFAQQLSDWFRETHPAASPVVPKAIEDQMRDTWHRRRDLIRGGE